MAVGVATWSNLRISGAKSTLNCTLAVELRANFASCKSTLWFYAGGPNSRFFRCCLWWVYLKHRNRSGYSYWNSLVCYSYCSGDISCSCPRNIRFSISVILLYKARVSNSKRLQWALFSFLKSIFESCTVHTIRTLHHIFMFVLSHTRKTRALWLAWKETRGTKMKRGIACHALE